MKTTIRTYKSSSSINVLPVEADLLTEKTEVLRERRTGPDRTAEPSKDSTAENDPVKGAERHAPNKPDRADRIIKVRQLIRPR